MPTPSDEELLCIQRDATGKDYIRQSEADYPYLANDEAFLAGTRAVREAVEASIETADDLRERIRQSPLLAHLLDYQSEFGAVWEGDDFDSQMAMALSELTGVWFEQYGVWTGEFWEGDMKEWDLDEWKQRIAEPDTNGQ